MRCPRRITKSCLVSLGGSYSYILAMSMTISICPICSLKTLYRKGWDTIFETIINNLQLRYNNISVFKQMKSCTESAEICKNCRISLIAWVDRIRRVNNVHEMENALLSTSSHGSAGNPTGLRYWENSPLCASCSLQCISLSDIKLMCWNGVQVMRKFPFSKFLKSPSPKSDIFTPATNAVIKQSVSLIRHSGLFSLMFPILLSLGASSSSWLSDHTAFPFVNSSLVVSRRSAGDLRLKQDGSVPTHPLCEHTYIFQWLHIAKPTNSVPS